ncbi:MAG: signal peptidase I, partial [Patescibacteria group bacterium]
MGRLFRTIQLIAAITFVSAGLLLVAFSLPFMGWKALSVQTGSMEPAIDTGSLVIVKDVPPASLRKGDVVTYKSVVQPGVTITHRLTDIKKPSDGPVQYITKGDANKTADRAVYGDQILGRVALSIPFVGSVLNAMRTPIGLVALIYIPAAFIAIGEIRLLVRRLTKIELEKQKATTAKTSRGRVPARQPQLATAPSVMAYEEGS